MKNTTRILVFCLFVFFVASCVDKSGIIKVPSKNFSISPPVGWEKQPYPLADNSLLSRELSSGNIYSIQWKNEDDSFIGVGAIKVVSLNGEPLIKTDIFSHSAIAYMQDGHYHDVQRFRETYPDLSYKYVDINYGYSQFNNFDMYQTKLMSHLKYNYYDDEPSLIVEMVSIWSDSYYYIFQLTAHKNFYEKDSIVFHSVINSLKPLQ